jgi:hypothetical protein
MAITDGIRVLAERANRDLDAINNFVEHTTLVWRSFRLWVQEGKTLEATNLETGMRVNQSDLVNLSEHYKTEYLLALTFQHYVATFEAFLFDFLRALLANEPRHLSHRKQIDIGTALSALDRQSLILIIADRELNELKYKRIGEWFEYLHGIVKTRCPTADEIEALAEIKASRDILVHNSAIANTIYIDKAGSRARYHAGEKVEIPLPYHSDSWRLIKKVVNDVSAAAIVRLGTPAPP